ncbi:MAG: hypothetical protein N3G19_00720 [Candidatus Pacearchaeota archaeon]|nr:hypothetical protein [Candidatus Pacearchaeota archaeon]
MSLLNIFGKNGKKEKNESNEKEEQTTVTYNLNEILARGTERTEDRAAEEKRVRERKEVETETSFVTATTLREPVKKTIFVFDEGFGSKEGDLIKKIVRKQKGISFFSISKKESFEIMSKLYKNDKEDLVIIKGNYKNIASDLEIENFIENAINKTNFQKPKILRKSLSLENYKNEGSCYKENIRDYLRKLNAEAGLNILVKDLKKNLEKKIENEINEAERFILELPEEPKVEMPTDMSTTESHGKKPDRDEKPFVKEILEEENPIDFIFKSNTKSNENKEGRQKEEVKKPFEGFMTDEEMGLKSSISHTIAISESCRSKVSLSYDELKRLTIAIPYAWKKLFPWCEIVVNEKDCIRVGSQFGLLMDAISFMLKEKETGKYTGDVIKINRDFFVIWRNGKEYYAIPTGKIIPSIIEISRKYEFNEKNLNQYIDPIVEQVSENYAKEKGVTIEQIISEKGKDAKEFECTPGVAYVDFSDMFVKDITACIEEIAEKKGSLAGLIATDEYKAPDSNNAGEICLKREDSRFTEVFNEYPKLDKLKGIATGPLFINAIVEAYHSDMETKNKKLDEASLLVKTLPKEYQSIAYSVIMEMKKKINQSNMSNAQPKIK